MGTQEQHQDAMEPKAPRVYSIPVEMESAWPRNCQYFDELTTDIMQLDSLLSHDTEYGQAEPSWGLSLLKFEGDSKAFYDSEHTARSEVIGLVEEDSEAAPLQIVHVHSKRNYRINETKLQIPLTRSEWLALLSKGQVHPSFLEALHSNAFANFAHITYLSESTKGDPMPGILHLCLRVGDFENHAFSLYAREDLECGNTFILFAGRGYLGLSRIARRIEGHRQQGMFQALLYFLESAYLSLQGVVWEKDFVTQALEARTGYSALMLPDNLPLPLKQIRFGEDLHLAYTFTQSILWACERFAEMCDFILAQLSRYEAMLKTHQLRSVSSTEILILRDGFHQKSCLFRGLASNVERLLKRLDGQMTVTRAITAERDSQTTIEIGIAAKSDSEAMKGISLITMIFLPATFTATFFSMVFFHVGDETIINFKVNGWIWIYFVVTVPLTIIFGLVYLHRNQPVSQSFFIPLRWGFYKKFFNG